MDLIKKFLKSLSEEEESETLDLKKASSEAEASIAEMLQKIDNTANLMKSDIAEQADIKAKNESADANADVFSIEAKLKDQKSGKDLQGGTQIPEQSDIKAKNESAEATAKVFSVEQKLDSEAPASKNAEVMLQKQKEMPVEEEEEEEEDMGEEKEEAGEEKEKLEKSSILSKTGASKQDIEMFDVSEPLAVLKKALDIVSKELYEVKKENSEIKNLIKSIVKVETKNFALQKSIATAIDEYSQEPNRPKGQISILHKTFDQNKEADAVDVPAVKEFTDTLFKGMVDGKIPVDQASKAISYAEVTGQVNPQHLGLFDLAKKK